MQKCINFITRWRNLTVNDFEKDLDKLLSNAFYGKTMDSLSSGIEIHFDEKDENEKNIKEQSEDLFI